MILPTPVTFTVVDSCGLGAMVTSCLQNRGLSLSLERRSSQELTIQPAGLGLVPEWGFRMKKAPAKKLEKLMGVEGSLGVQTAGAPSFIEKRL